ncbi:acyl dehydratase [Dehalococcoidia bacterium]|nr:acyl dehydratase [Dehalococcoidia bacterium]
MADWSKQTYWEDVNEGDEIPSIDFNVGVQRLVVEAGANRDFNPIHHNTRLAQAQGAPEMYANNTFILGWWERTAREFIGLEGVIKKLGPFRLRIFNTVGETVVCKGKVVKKWQEDGENFIELEMWSEHTKGISSGPGPVVATLPSK